MVLKGNSAMCSCGEEKQYEGNNCIGFLKKLIKVSDNAREWKTLYKCQDCGEYWELSYPQSELHGGGPPLVCKLKTEELKRKWGIGLKFTRKLALTKEKLTLFQRKAQRLKKRKGMETVKPRFQCCFCGKTIERREKNICTLVFTSNLDGHEESHINQQFFCHAKCFKKRVHRKIPLYF
ncbi:MAG: Imm27 family immunity protein [Firmicutes bacterium]|nr:Imm27 family immunity protein [Bacillota bacterium]